jgi:hypothetical protein
MDRNAVEYIKVGDRVQVVTNQTGDVYDSTVTSVDKDSQKIIFELDQPDFSIKVGTRGTVTVVRGEADGVLSLPKTCVFAAEDFWFVYVLTDEGVREMRKVTIGLVGNDYIEITGGVSESDSVILRKS